MTPAERTLHFRAAAREQGIDKFGVARAGDTGEADRLGEWLGRGFQAGMSWMERWREKRVDPRELVPGAQSVVCVALNYYHEIPPGSRYHETPPASRSEGREAASFASLERAQNGERLAERPVAPHGGPPAATGRVARYAWGEDYHRVLKDKLKAVLRRLQEVDPGLGGRAFVDSAPVQEKFWAQQAGLGWRGKNSNVITTELGSWVVLGELVLNRELVYDAPHPDHCGSCTRCIDACPTAAIVEPYVVDSRICLSYLTIEHRGEIGVGPADTFQEWAFGCDVCQEVCPWNAKHAQPSREPRLAPRAQQVTLDLAATAALSDEEFHARFGDAALERARPEGLRRNARLLLENRARDAARPAGEMLNESQFK
jgi:epoxyqueuosine reductase